MFGLVLVWVVSRVWLVMFMMVLFCNIGKFWCIWLGLKCWVSVCEMVSVVLMYCMLWFIILLMLWCFSGFMLYLW